MKFSTTLLLFLIFSCKADLQQVKGPEPYSIKGMEVYYGEELLPEADAETFEELQFGYAQDAVNVYWYGKILKDADADSFKVVGQNKGRDFAHVYIKNLLVSTDSGAIYKRLKEYN